jgi:hypothetical protein
MVDHYYKHSSTLFKDAKPFERRALESYAREFLC